MLRLDDALEEDGFGVVVLEELLHRCGEFLLRRTPDGVYAHRFCEEDEVGVGHLGVCVSLLVEEV